MSTTEPIKGELSKMDIAALRQADTVVFFHNACRHEGDERGSFLKAVKRVRVTETNPFATDQSYFIDTESNVTFYGDDAHRRTQDGVVGCESIDEWKDEWKTIRAFLKVGDIVRLRWTASNNNENNREVGWERDELRLVVHRGSKTHTFLIDVYVGPNNSARSITTLGYVFR